MHKKTNGDLKLRFLGGTQTITGSKFLISKNSSNWMIDCGLFQGLKQYRSRNWAQLPLSPKEVKSVILTHAHIDHSGYLPLFVKDGFHGKVYCSNATAELCKILLPDAGHIQEEDAKFANKKGFSKHKPALPLYTYQDAIDSLTHLEKTPDHTPIQLEHGITFEMFRAGHILGSRFIKIISNGSHKKSILFAGDIGRYDSLIVKEPETIDNVDYLVLESTYGDHTHPEEDILERFANIINETADQNGKILIPSFAVGRTQEILYIIKQLFEADMIPKKLPVFLNSPLGIDATDIYMRFQKEERDVFLDHIKPRPFSFSNLHMVQSEEESKRLNLLDGPAVIIAGSGMMTGGRILHHLKWYGPDEKSTLVIVGFQAEGTRGRAILNGAKITKIHGQQVFINCRVEQIESLSAHGDYSDIIKWLKFFKRKPKMTFLVHGEEKSLNAMKERISSTLGWNVTIPKYLDNLPLS